MIERIDECAVGDVVVRLRVRATDPILADSILDNTAIHSANCVQDECAWVLGLAREEGRRDAEAECQEERDVVQHGSESFAIVGEETMFGCCCEVKENVLALYCCGWRVNRRLAREG